jgi:hypothetical protein
MSPQYGTASLRQEMAAYAQTCRHLVDQRMPKIAPFPPFDETCVEETAVASARSILYAAPYQPAGIGMVIGILQTTVFVA